VRLGPVWKMSPIGKVEQVLVWHLPLELSYYWEGAYARVEHCDWIIGQLQWLLYWCKI